MSAQAEFIGRLERALRLDLPFFKRPPSGAGVGRPSAVLIVFGFDRSSLPRVLLTLRGAGLAHHQGQVSFPGGRLDPEDERQESPYVAAALREAFEETGLASKDLRVLGELPELSTLSTGFRVRPIVAELLPPLEEIRLSEPGEEVERAVWIPFEEFTAPKAAKTEEIRSGNFKIRTAVFETAGLRIWGATAAMLQNLADRFRQLHDASK